MLTITGMGATTFSYIACKLHVWKKRLLSWFLGKCICKYPTTLLLGRSGQVFSAALLLWPSFQQQPFLILSRPYKAIKNVSFFFFKCTAKLFAGQILSIFDFNFISFILKIAWANKIAQCAWYVYIPPYAYWFQEDGWLLIGCGLFPLIRRLLV